MSRSKKHIPIFGITKSDSEKKDKRLNNRRLRRKVKELLTEIETDEKVLPIMKDVSNVWSMQKDGKQYWPPDKMKQRGCKVWKEMMK